MARGFAANIIGGIDRLISRLNHVDVELAIRLLNNTLNDYPRPPWNTGELRSSGAVYIGGRLIQTNPQIGSNPNGAWEKHGNSGYVSDVGAGAGTIKELRIAKIRTSDDVSVSTLKGKITVIYTSDIAAVMHEWPGGFSDPDSGPYYISAKLITFGGDFHEAFRNVFK